MPSAADDIRSAIAEANGAIAFEQFMAIALYGPNGFYQQGGSAGRRGDFITSPEIGPLFGAVLARALDQWWDELGRPSVYTVVEVGAGPGTLARSIRVAEPLCWTALRYVAVEVSAAQRFRHPDWVTSVAAMPTEPFVGVILANELLDNLPLRLLVMDGEWREAFVVARPDGSFGEVLRSVELPVELPVAAHGSRVPVQQQAAEWVKSSLDLLQVGRVVAIDYTRPTTLSVAAVPWREWLRTYAGHERGQHYLKQPGMQDITSDVVLDQLADLVGWSPEIESQANFLARFGIHDLVAAGQAFWTAHAASPSVEAMRMRSRVRESEALCEPFGLGSFNVLTWTTP